MWQYSVIVWTENFFRESWAHPCRSDADGFTKGASSFESIMGDDVELEKLAVCLSVSLETRRYDAALHLFPPFSVSRFQTLL